MIEVMRPSCAILLASLLIASPLSSLHAQTKTGFEGTVSDTLGNYLEDVQVGLVGTSHYTVTDGRGAFHLPDVKPGSYTLSMRRLGYDPLTMTFVILQSNAMSVDFELTESAVRIAPVNIKSERISAKLRRVGFESRMKTSGAPASHFLTRTEMEKTHVQSLTNVVDKMGGRARACEDPAVYMDGLPYQTFADFGGALTGRTTGVTGTPRSSTRNPAPATTKNTPLDAILLRSIEGVEIYTNPSETPAQYKQGLAGQQNNRCVVLLWTRER